MQINCYIAMFTDDPGEQEVAGHRPWRNKSIHPDWEVRSISLLIKLNRKINAGKLTPLQRKRVGKVVAIVVIFFC